MKRFSGHWFGDFLRPNWYLPVHLGGLGFGREYAPPTMRITKEQRIVAAMFFQNPSMALYRLKGGIQIPTSKYFGALANTRMVVGDYVIEEHEEFSLQDPWLERPPMRCVPIQAPSRCLTRSSIRSSVVTIG